MAKKTKTKLNKWDYNKLKSFSTEKEMKPKIKENTPLRGRNIHTSDIEQRANRSNL